VQRVGCFFSVGKEARRYIQDARQPLYRANADVDLISSSRFDVTGGHLAQARLTAELKLGQTRSLTSLAEPLGESNREQVLCACLSHALRLHQIPGESHR
jgi:hypothetical protein